MTCEEFQVMRKKSPTDCTVAERAAFAKHVLFCDGCMKRLFSSASQKPFTDEQIKNTKRMVEENREDPEDLKEKDLPGWLRDEDES